MSSLIRKLPDGQFILLAGSMSILGALVVRWAYLELGQNSRAPPPRSGEGWSSRNATSQAAQRREGDCLIDAWISRRRSHADRPLWRAPAMVRIDDLSAVPIGAGRAQLGVDWGAVDDVIYGCANQAAKTIATWAAWRCSSPACRRCSGTTVNCFARPKPRCDRLRGSGDQWADVARHRRRRQSMSRRVVLAKADAAFARHLRSSDTTIAGASSIRNEATIWHRQHARAAENVAAEFGIPVPIRTRFAPRSQTRSLPPPRSPPGDSRRKSFR